MNLQAITVGVISAINPQVNCTLKMSTGYSTLPDGTRVPTYALFPNLPCQIQPLSTDDLMQMERPGVASGLNLQGQHKAVYLNGTWEGLNRNAIKGGDLFEEPDGTIWLVTIQLEDWPDWSKFACTLQVRR